MLGEEDQPPALTWEGGGRGRGREPVNSANVFANEPFSTRWNDPAQDHRQAARFGPATRTSQHEKTPATTAVTHFINCSARNFT